MAKTLNELNWFSFPGGFKEQPDFSIWQAIAYILNTRPKCEGAFEEYTDNIRTLESDMANDLLEYYEEFNKPVLVHNKLLNDVSTVGGQDQSGQYRDEFACACLQSEASDHHHGD